MLTTINAGISSDRMTIQEMTYEGKCSALGLLLTAEFEAKTNVSDGSDMEMGDTHCLQRFKASCILYLQTVHSRRNTTFFVVLAYY